MFEQQILKYFALFLLLIAMLKLAIVEVSALVLVFAEHFIHFGR